MQQTQEAALAPVFRRLRQAWAHAWVRRWPIHEGIPIRIHLTALVAAVLLPILCLLAIVAFKYAEAERRAIEAQRLGAVNELETVVERRIERAKALLRGLAASPGLDAGNLDAFRKHAEAAAKTQNIDGIVLMDRGGQQLVSTIVPPGQALPKRNDMSPLDGVFTGKETVSGLAHGTASKRDIVIIAVPVIQGEKVVYALTAGIYVSQLTALFVEAALQPGWCAAIIDRQGHYLARSKGTNPNRLAPPDLIAAAFDGRPSGLYDYVKDDGTVYSAGYRRSPLSDWVFIVGIPRSVLNAPFQRMVWMLVAGSVATILFASGLASLLARRISKPILTLRGYAKSLVDGRELKDINSGIAELNEVVRAFRYADKIAGERRHLHEQLVISQERLRQAIAVASIGTFYHNHTSGGLEFSPALCGMFGFGENEVIDMDKWLDRVHPDDRDFVVWRVSEAHRPGGDGYYESEHRVVHPLEGIRWLHVRSRTYFEGEGTGRRPVRTIGAVHEVTERRKAEEHLRFLMSELSHRSKNLLAVIQAMAKRTARSALSLDNFQSAFGDRLRAMAISHDLLVSQNWACVSLRLLILRQFELFGTLRSAQLHYHGPEVSIEPAAAQSIGLALHELTTNSIKYGALSRPSGKVTVSWGFKGDERNRLWLCWRESGGPPVEPPKREGFGHVVIRDMIAYSLEGEVSIDFAPSGLTWTAIFPSSVIVANGPTIEQGASARANA